MQTLCPKENEDKFKLLFGLEMYMFFLDLHQLLILTVVKVGSLQVRRSN